MEQCATIDFETFSAADIKYGPHYYAIHPTTDIYFLSYALPHWPDSDVVTWWSDQPLDVLEPLFDWIRSDGLVEAHNSRFEEEVWRHVGVPKYNFPEVPNLNWRDSAAKAAARSLPRSLDDALVALDIPIRKDPLGKALIRKHSIPKKLTKIEREMYGDDAIIFNRDLESLKQYAKYNAQDVKAERALSRAIPDLSPTELRIWQITCEMNRRGSLIDKELCVGALKVVREAKRRLNEELFEMTGIEKGSARTQLAEWLAEHEGLDLPDTAAKTLEWYLYRSTLDLSPRCRRVLQIIREVNRTSTKKYEVIMASRDPKTGRVYDLLAYCGAERTGRWSGQGIQVQNLPKGTLPKGFDLEVAVAAVKTGSFDECRLVHDDVMALVVSCLRGTIIAPKGRVLAVADYAAIEARCVLWLAGAEAALKVFLGGGDIYCDMASGIFGREITKKNLTVITRSGKTERDFGKVAILGLGYGMGFIKFLLTLRDYDIYLSREEVTAMMGADRLARFEEKVARILFPQLEDFEDKDDPKKSYQAAKRQAALFVRALTDAREEPFDIQHELALCLYTVGIYRKRYGDVPDMWKAQEKAAIEALRKKNTPVECGRVTWLYVGRTLTCELPSGRKLHYADAHLAPAKTSWGEVKDSIRFWGRHQKTRKWSRLSTYGGKITENITQATARDIMAYAMIELADDADKRFDLDITVHDEIVAEADEGVVTVKEYEEIMVKMPPGVFEGCPIAAEALFLTRYQKA